MVLSWAAAGKVLVEVIVKNDEAELGVESSFPSLLSLFPLFFRVLLGDLARQSNHASDSQRTHLYLLLPK